MNFFSPLLSVMVYAVMAVCIVGSLGVVFLRNIFHAALCLMVVLIGIAAFYLALHAEFLAVVQILLYVGGVLTLIIFAIMMTEQAETRQSTPLNNLFIPALFAAAPVFLLLSKLFYRSPWKILPSTLQSHVSVADLGSAFVGPYLFPFEVISVILIAVLIGALIVAKRDGEKA